MESNDHCEQDQTEIVKRLKKKKKLSEEFCQNKKTKQKHKDWQR
jgi:hypothetical protein